ncbi:MAG: CBS domain-containing protein [Actinomycetota bacterium]|nr:CBS domain-containing protein [Actinomycetota bacterium]
MTVASCTARAVSLDALMLSPGHTLHVALARQRRTGHGIVVTLDDDGVVVGTVTDDSVRRAILAGHTLDALVEEAATTKPIVCPTAATDEQAVEIVRAHGIRLVPVIDIDPSRRLADVPSFSSFPDSPGHRSAC